MILGEIISETIGVARQESTSISFFYFLVNGIELVCCFIYLFVLKLQNTQKIQKTPFSILFWYSSENNDSNRDREEPPDNRLSWF